MGRYDDYSDGELRARGGALSVFGFGAVLVDLITDSGYRYSDRVLDRRSEYYGELARRENDRINEGWRRAFELEDIRRMGPPRRIRGGEPSISDYEWNRSLEMREKERMEAEKRIKREAQESAYSELSKFFGTEKLDDVSEKTFIQKMKIYYKTLVPIIDKMSESEKTKLRGYLEKCRLALAPEVKLEIIVIRGRLEMEVRAIDVDPFDSYAYDLEIKAEKMGIKCGWCRPDYIRFVLSHAYEEISWLVAEFKKTQLGILLEEATRMKLPEGKMFLKDKGVLELRSPAGKTLVLKQEHEDELRMLLLEIDSRLLYFIRGAQFDHLYYFDSGQSNIMFLRSDDLIPKDELMRFRPLYSVIWAYLKYAGFDKMEPCSVGLDLICRSLSIRKFDTELREEHKILTARKSPVDVISEGTVKPPKSEDRNSSRRTRIRA